MEWSHILFALLVLMFAGFGGYCLRMWWITKSWKKLQPNEFLYPVNGVPSACLDPEVYLHFLRPRLLLLGIWVLLGAAVSVLVWVLTPTPFWAAVALLLWALSAVLLYTGWMAACARHYWP